MVSARPIVSGDGPREEPTPTPAVRNSRLATLSARDIVAGDIRPRGEGPSPLRDGGLGITIEPVGVEDADCLGGNAGVMSPTSENKSPSGRSRGKVKQRKEKKRKEKKRKERTYARKERIKERLILLARSAPRPKDGTVWYRTTALGSLGSRRQIRQVLA